jgi:hypothetical protein
VIGGHHPGPTAYLSFGGTPLASTGWLEPDGGVRHSRMPRSVGVSSGERRNAFRWNGLNKAFGKQVFTTTVAMAAPRATVIPAEPISHQVDPVRSAAGRLGGKRVHQLAELGRQYEREHGLKAGRQRLKQLVQLGKKYEQEHGLRPAPRRRRKSGDAWQEFLVALARVIKPAHRPAVEQLVAALRPTPKVVAVEPEGQVVQAA